MLHQSRRPDRRCRPPLVLHIRKGAHRLSSPWRPVLPPSTGPTVVLRSYPSIPRSRPHSSWIPRLDNPDRALRPPGLGESWGQGHHRHLTHQGRHRGRAKAMRGIMVSRDGQRRYDHYRPRPRVDIGQRSSTPPFISKAGEARVRDPSNFRPRSAPSRSLVGILQSVSKDWTGAEDEEVQRFLLLLFRR